MDDGAFTAVDPEARLDRLRGSARDCRRAWRWHWEHFWMLRWENALRRPAWRIDEETRAWRRMRAEVRQYARVRAEITAALSERRAPMPEV